MMNELKELNKYFTAQSGFRMEQIDGSRWISRNYNELKAWVGITKRNLAVTLVIVQNAP